MLRYLRRLTNYIYNAVGSLIPARYSGTMKTEYKNVHTKLHLLRSRKPGSRVLKIVCLYLDHKLDSL